MFKNIHQQLTGYLCINGNTRTLIFIENHLLLHNDQRTGFDLAHLIYGTYNFGIDLVQTSPVLLCTHRCRTENREDNILSSQLFQCTSKLRLKNNHNNRHKHTCGLRHDPCQCCQMKEIGTQGKNRHDNNALQKCPGSGVLDPYQQFINNNCEDKNFNNIGNMKRLRQSNIRQ